MTNSISKLNIFYIFVIFLLSTKLVFSMPKSPDGSSVIYWENDQSALMFNRSKVKKSFNALAPYFESQANKFYCGIASATIVLNALRLHSNFKKDKLPSELALYGNSTELNEVVNNLNLPKNYSPVFNRYTQNSFFNKDTDIIKTKAQILGKEHTSIENGIKKYDGGVKLNELALMLEKYGVIANVTAVNDNAYGSGRNENSYTRQSTELRNNIMKILSTSDQFVIVNFDRFLLRQSKDPGFGHISPVVAYDQETDSFLIMDVNTTMYSWEWVKALDLINAMHSLDGDSYRGFIVVSKKFR